MKGHVERVGKSTYRVVAEHGIDANGRRKRVVRRVPGGKRQAEAELTRLLNEIETGTYIDENKLTVAKYLEHWLKHYAKPKVGRRTYERYEEIVKKHLIPALGGVKLRNLRPIAIQAYYSKALESGRLAKKKEDTEDGEEQKPRGLSASTVHHHHAVLKQALRQAVKWRMLAVNPADGVDPPKPQRVIVKWLSADEAAGLLTVLEGTKLHLPALMALTTGMRRGEVLGLRWGDVDLDGARLSVAQTLQDVAGEVFTKAPKTKSSERTIALLPLTVAALRVHKKEQNALRLRRGKGYQNNDLVLAREGGNPWHPGSFSAEWRSEMLRLGRPIKFHELRHTHASMLLANREHPKVVQERLGHSTISTTYDIYSHAMPEMQEGAAATLDGTFSAALRKAHKNAS
jgi:integrase